MTPTQQCPPDAGTAYVDESVLVNRPPGHYVVAAVIVPDDAQDQTRRVLRALAQPARRLHWHDEGVARRFEVSEAVAAMELEAVVVVASPVEPKRQERARRKCLDLLLHELVTSGAGSAVLERRTASLNSGDKKLVARLRGQRLIPTGFRVDFGRPMEEPLLWLPDVIAGVTSADLRGRGEYAAKLQRGINVHHIGN